MATIHFKGKSYVQNHHLTLKYHHLVPNSAASCTDKISLHDNLIIHGDNLLALKALLPTYAGKVKCIYIDPPYNTGNEGWIYNDNVNSPMMQDWLKANAPIDKEDLARHDKWLCMMMPRLKLLRELLRDDGVIFISIVVPSTWWDRKFAGDNQKARREVKKIFEELENPFDSPKPSSLLQLIFKIAADENSIILDSLAGSGTTAQAVLALNREDGGNRKFILIEMEDYADSLTAERVGRVIKGVPKAKDEALKNGLGGSFSFFELGEPIEIQAILEGGRLPAYEDLARYVFYTATGDEFDPAKIDYDRHYIGENPKYEVYLFYQPDLDYLRSTALDLDKAEKLGRPKPNSKRRLVFAPMKYLDSDTLERYWIEHCQLPFEIYK